jgi:hypothetical protein
MFKDADTSSIDIISSKDIIITDSNMTSEVGKVNDFYDNKLNYISDETNKTKYYSFYNALVNIDKKTFTRSDSLHIPKVPTLIRSELNIQDKNETIGSVFDINIVVCGDKLQPAKNGITVKQIINKIEKVENLYYFDRKDIFKELHNLTQIRQRIIPNF